MGRFRKAALCLAASLAITGFVFAQKSAVATTIYFEAFNSGLSKVGPNIILQTSGISGDLSISFQAFDIVVYPDGYDCRCINANYNMWLWHTIGPDVLEISLPAIVHHSLPLGGPPIPSLELMPPTTIFISQLFDTILMNTTDSQFYDEFAAGVEPRLLLAFASSELFRRADAA